MKSAALWAGLAVAPVCACTWPIADGEVWVVRSVRPLTAATRALVGQPLRTVEIEAARRSFDAAPGGRISISVTLVQVERCEAGEADLVFRVYRFRAPYGFRLTPALDLARSWAAGGAAWHRDWQGGKLSASYSAGYSREGLRQAGSLEIRGSGVETRLVAGNDSVSARVLAGGPMLWQRPLLPAELRENPEFDEQVQAALASTESLLRLEHYSRDAHFQRIARRLKALAKQPCLPASFLRRLNSAQREVGGSRQYGLVDALLSANIPSSCEAAQELALMREDFGQIDRAGAARRAKEELGEFREIVHRLLHRTPLIAVRPVAIVEAIRSGRRTALPGVGAGVRVSLLNWIHATAGYSWRVRRQNGEPSGAPFLEMRFRDPFE